MTTLPDRLKTETAAEHAAIERAVGLLDPGLTRAGYAAYLARTLGLYRPLEAALAGVPGLEAQLPDLAGRWKVPLLERDLAALGQPPGPVCEAVPRVEGVGRALGCLYVLEGATLGGKVLLRQLGPRLGLEGASAFLGCYGEEVGPRWRAFRAALEGYPGDPDPVVAAARETFAALIAWHSPGR